jgi:DinB superfamily
MLLNDLILMQLDQAFRRKSWHGTNLLGSIRGIDVETASWRPAPGRHNIWELIVHAAYWKYSVYRRLANEPAIRFPVKGSNWFERPAGTELKADIDLLKDYHKKLIESVSTLPSSKLTKIPKGSKTTYLDLAIGAAAHDLYHAGQIQLIKRLR